MARTPNTTTSDKAANIHDQKLIRGNGGELHHIAKGNVPALTTAQGGPVSDDQNALKIGARGLIEDFPLRSRTRADLGRVSSTAEDVLMS